MLRAGQAAFGASTWLMGMQSQRGPHGLATNHEWQGATAGAKGARPGDHPSVCKSQGPKSQGGMGVPLGMRVMR